MTTIQFDLNVPQSSFLQLPHKFKAYVAGFGSGKTFVGCAGICAHFWQWPGINQGYFAPTYPQIRDIFYPTMEEVAYAMGLRIKVKQGDHEVEVYEGRRYRGTVICRSMEKPETIVGFKIGHALIDELDVMPLKKAQTAWRKIIARMRYKVPGLMNGIDVTTTPEGFKFVYPIAAAEPHDRDERFGDGMLSPKVLMDPRNRALEVELLDQLARDGHDVSGARRPRLPAMSSRALVADFASKWGRMTLCMPSGPAAAPKTTLTLFSILSSMVPPISAGR